jgi:hypothetical protein
MAYIDESNTKQRPIMIHRAIFGSLERFFGILIEHYAGAFPLWLAPMQVRHCIQNAYLVSIRACIGTAASPGLPPPPLLAGPTLHGASQRPALCPCAGAAAACERLYAAVRPGGGGTHARAGRPRRHPALCVHC